MAVRRKRRRSIGYKRRSAELAEARRFRVKVTRELLEAFKQADLAMLGTKRTNER